MARKVLEIAGLLALFVVGSALAFLKTPAPRVFDTNAAAKTAEQYSARIIRDGFGVPHIYGARDADVAFGLAYAHAEDDWKTIEDVLFFSRGTLSSRKGEEAAVMDFLVGALRVSDTIAERYMSDLSPETRAIAEAYAAGANLYCAEVVSRCAPGAAPVTGHDIVSGFFSRTPFFYGLDDALKGIFDGNVASEIETSREAFLKLPRGFETGSNAMAVAPSRSADGHTRLMVNSHQPYEGPVAWYEARIKSGEGWDMIGSLFPGAPLILHGAGPDLGWAFTVNKPDLVDVFRLVTDDLNSPQKYRMDDEWRELEIWPVRFRVNLPGPFSLPITRKAYASVHGPAFVTEHGVFAVSYANDDNIQAIEQWYEMNRATSYAQWRSAISRQAIPSFNIVYGDGEGNIVYFYNAAIPKRDPSPDWSLVQPGDDPALVWDGTQAFEILPKVENPVSGYVVNANNMPFEASAPDDSPRNENFPPHYGIDRRTTNRGIRIQQLYGGDPSITAEEFVSYKMDHFYAEQSRVRELVRNVVTQIDERNDDRFDDVRALLKAWDGSVAKDNRAAALIIGTAQRARGPLLNDENIIEADMMTALEMTMNDLEKTFGRIDPMWSEVVQLKRGDVTLPLNGGPDTLRAVYGDGDISSGSMKSVGGDTYILYADWSGPREVEIKTIHQYGAATLDDTSPHYADQAELFANEQWKSPPMQLRELLSEATSNKVVGRHTD